MSSNMLAEALHLVIPRNLPHLPCKLAMVLVLFPKGMLSHECPQGLAFGSHISLQLHNDGVATANGLAAIILQCT